MSSQTNARAPASGDTIGGKYVVEDLLGRGGMGAVYRARHAITDRPIALKWLLPDPGQGDVAVQRFLREARAMGRIDHPNVVGVIDFGSEGGSAWLAMELLRGRALRAHVVEGQRLTAPEAIALLRPALEGVAAAHRVGVIHRDLKPENLFVVEDEEGRPRTTKVLDFGISKVHEDPSKLAPITQTGTTMGTPSYMAPEQVRGAKDVDARADVWSLAVILYELLSARTPFHAETYGGLMVAICTEPHAPIVALAPEVPIELSRVLDRALAKEPADRYGDVLSFLRALEPFAAPSAASPLASLAGATRRDGAPDEDRSTATPTRPVKGSAAARDISVAPTGLAPRVELDSQAQRRPGARPSPSNPSVPLSVPDLPRRSEGAPRRTRAVVGALAIAALVPVLAVIASESMRSARGTSSPPATEPTPTIAVPGRETAISGRETAGPVGAAATPDAGIAAATPGLVAPGAAGPGDVAPREVAPGATRAGTPGPAAHARAPRSRRVGPATTAPVEAAAVEVAPVEVVPAARAVEPAVRGRTGQLSREEF